MGLKVIHNQLLHLSWQGHQIAEGDYNQRVDFMGDFGKTFNWAVECIKKQKEEFETNRIMLLNLFNALRSVIVLIDAETDEIVFNNREAENICRGHTDLKNEKQDGLIGRLHALCKQPPQDKEKIIYYDRGLNRWFKILMTETRWTEQKKVELFYCVDITKEQAELERMKEAAIDAVTGLLTRSQGLPKIEELYGSLTEGQLLAVAFFDMDGLKRVNDSIGHAAGDDLLRRFALGLKKTFRAKDVTIRLGGDEFVAGFTVDSKKTAAEILKRFANNIEKQNEKIDAAIRVEYSQGLCFAKYKGKETVENLLETADALMYEDKMKRKAAKGLKPEDR